MRDDIKGALAEAESLAELEAFPWPTPDCLDRSRLPDQCRRYEDHALLYGFADVWQRPALVRGWEGFLPGHGRATGLGPFPVPQVH